ncbi:amyloid-beta-like protein isoform X2 [Palaemon carinicauda]|uniref:amyloid-beta-like protein isoform X2 n=1 Tax=Palaemon carinicauda TaxID=392227 RepID=UPI0035B66E9F
MRLLLISFVNCAILASTHAAGYVEGRVGFRSGVSGGEAGPRFEPQVAMMCIGRSQYHAQYMSETGRWVTDSNSKVTCLKDKVDILRYCKQVYPERDITNIVESSHYYRVPNFCRVGHVKCKTSAWVKPYRCLGSFQSDALLVPEGCLFDHIHNQSRCWEFDRWNTTADRACGARRMTLKSFAMLLPCGIDVFSGVEFVCCPKNYKGHGKAHPMEVEEPVALPQMDHRVHQSASTTPSPKVPTTTTSQEVGTRDEYFSRFDPHEEHDAFRRAEQRLEERHREKVSKIMKEWSDLEERYQDLRAKDPRGAEEFKHRMTQRFQQTVEAVEAENEAERHQLTALHQQRIVAHINEMKREAMTCYTRALAEKQPNTHKVQKCLQKLLRALNKDRHHTVSHYKHLLNSDYEAADRERDATLQHLSDLERMVNQSLNMLSRHPDLNAKIGRLMREYSAALRSKDSTPPELSTHAPVPLPSVTKADDGSLDNVNDSTEGGDISDDDEDEGETVSADQNRDLNDEEEDDDEDDDDDDDRNESGSDEETFPEHAEPNGMTQTSHAEALESNIEEEVVSQDPVEVDTLTVDGMVREASPVPNVSTPPEPLLLHHADDVQVAHAQHHQISHSQASYSVTRESSGSESRGVYFTVAFAGVALMMAMVVGIVVLRRRNSTNPHNQGFMEVDQAITPEERHVANMQVNGYENPTYKYFEEK